MNLRDDIAALQRSDVVIGLHGGGFGNIVYARKGTVVIEMNVPEIGGRQCFAYMSHNLGLHYHRYGISSSMYDEYTPGDSFYGMDVRVNVTAFVTFLDAILSQHLLLPPSPPPTAHIPPA
jgi:capsular polysaccharide biosynthesis protein